MKKMLILFFVLIWTIICTSQIKPILKLDTGGHMGAIKDLVITSDGRNLISGSQDKTIRVWDIETKREVRKILGQVGSGTMGMINTIALSPDDRYLVVGGNLSDETDAKINRIRVYNFKTGKLEGVLVSHWNAIIDLTFSADSRYLASGSHDRTVKVWDVEKNFELVHTFKGHKDAIYAVCLFDYKGEYRLVSAGLDKKINLYSVDSRKRMKSLSYSHSLWNLTVSDRFIAASGEDKKIRLFDLNLNPITTIISDIQPSALSFSPDGRLLLEGTGIKPWNCCVYDVDNNFQKITTFGEHDYPVTAITFFDNNTAVTGGGNKKDIFFWNARTGSSMAHLVGDGKTVWLVGIKDKQIAFGSTWAANKRKSKFEKKFDLEKLTSTILTSEQESFGFNRISRRYGEYSLIHSTGGDHGYSDEVLLIMEADNQKSRRLVRRSHNGYRHRSYGFSTDGLIISGGLHGFLTAYDINFQHMANFVGHTGEVWGLAVDGHWLASCGSDQIIKLWNLQGLSDMKPNAYHNIYPTLSLFVSKDNEWVIWTEEGFFNCSENGARYIGYHINQGQLKEAEWISVDKLYNIFYRPDLVEAKFNGKDISEYASAVNIQKILTEGGLAPRVDFVTSSSKSKNRDILLKAKLTNQGGGIGDVTLFLNGIPIMVESDKRAVRVQSTSTETDDALYNFEKLISLKQGKNIISLMACNRENTVESDRAVIELTYGTERIEKPDLHILAIAVDQYRDGDLRLSYSKGDAEAIIQLVKNKADKIFNDFHVYEIYDREVQKKNIENVFKNIGQNTNREDVFLLFIAGHGITFREDGNYYFLPSDFRYTSEAAIVEQGVSINDFKKYLSNVKALKSLLLLDTCNSGSFAEAISSRGMLEKTAVNKLIRATGRATIVASSKDQVALEGYEDHGVFTYTVLQALGGLADYNQDEKISISELGMYVETVLPEITYKKWGYEQVPQKTLQGMDFPIVIR